MYIPFGYNESEQMEKRKKARLVKEGTSFEKNELIYSQNRSCSFLGGSKWLRSLFSPFTGPAECKVKFKKTIPPC